MYTSYLRLIAFLLALIMLIVSIGGYINKSTPKVEASEPVSVSVPAESSEPETVVESVIPFYDVPLDIETQKEILEMCFEYDLTYELILGIISVESDFRSTVIGDGGESFGLMQIQPKWWSETMNKHEITNLLDPLQNIHCGCAILRELIDRYGTEYRALQAYNTGRPDSNNGYADKVYKAVDELRLKECYKWIF